MQYLIFVLVALSIFFVYTACHCCAARFADVVAVARVVILIVILIVVVVVVVNESINANFDRRHVTDSKRNAVDGSVLRCFVQPVIYSQSGCVACVRACLFVCVIDSVIQVDG